METRKKQVLHYVDDQGVDVYQRWLELLKDALTRAKIQARIDRIEEGLFGDCRFVGKGVWELRMDTGPGYRVYLGQDAGDVILLLLGGDKSTQKKDIRRAHLFWSDFRRSK